MPFTVASNAYIAHLETSLRTISLLSTFKKQLKGDVWLSCFFMPVRSGLLLGLALLCLVDEFPAIRQGDSAKEWQNACPDSRQTG